MADQFDLEQGIMGCWQITNELDLLGEELLENDYFTTDQAANFALGLKTIYEAKFNKLYRDFESFFKQYYNAVKSNQKLTRQLEALREEQEERDGAAALTELEEVLDSEDALNNCIEDEFSQT